MWADVLATIGAALLVVGLYQLYAPLAFILPGVALLAAAAWLVWPVAEVES